MATLIQNAKLYDGTGRNAFIADVAFDNGIITAVAPAGTLAAAGHTVINADGLALAPGFIDAHGHSDTTAIKNPTCDAKISQGCTTEIVGNCGVSKCVEVMDRWDTVAAYAQAVDDARPAINIATLVGHNSVRERVMGYENRPATAAEMSQMKAIISTALAEGACGMSSGLWYLPGRYSPTWEIVELGECLRNTGKPYVTHMRSEGDGLLEAVDEALAVAANGSNRLQISHIKAAPQQNWHKITALLAKVEAARASGMTVYADRYPYTYSGTGLRMTLDEPWNSIADIHGYLQDAAHAAEVAAAIDASHDAEQTWKRIILLGSDYAGKTIFEVAQMLGITPGQATVMLLARHPGLNAAFGKMSEENMRTYLRQPWVAAGSDAHCLPTDYSLGRAHPRAFGTFPLFFKYATEHCSKEDVIRRMTSLPANIYNLRGRGAVLPGYHADLVLFDEHNFAANSTYAEPHKLASGVAKVFVDGKLAFDGAAPADIQRHGHFLKL